MGNSRSTASGNVGPTVAIGSTKRSLSDDSHLIESSAGPTPAQKYRRHGQRPSSGTRQNGHPIVTPASTSSSQTATSSARTYLASDVSSISNGSDSGRDGRASRVTRQARNMLSAPLKYFIGDVGASDDHFNRSTHRHALQHEICESVKIAPPDPETLARKGFNLFEEFPNSCIVWAYTEISMGYPDTKSTIWGPGSVYHSLEVGT